MDSVIEAVAAHNAIWGPCGFVEVNRCGIVRLHRDMDAFVNVAWAEEEGEAQDCDLYLDG